MRLGCLPYTIYEWILCHIDLDSINFSVTLSAPDGRAFKGFMVVALRVTGDREKSLGTFTNYPANKAQLTYCAFDQNVSVRCEHIIETTF